MTYTCQASIYSGKIAEQNLFAVFCVCSRNSGIVNWSNARWSEPAVFRLALPQERLSTYPIPFVYFFPRSRFCEIDDGDFTSAIWPIDRGWFIRRNCVDRCELDWFFPWQSVRAYNINIQHAIRKSSKLDVETVLHSSFQNEFDASFEIEWKHRL